MKRNIMPYVIYTVIIILMGSILQRWLLYFYINPLVYPDWDQGGLWQVYRYLQSAMIITSPLIFIIGFTFITRWVSSEQRAELLEKEKLKAELGYLRTQINPHFFFNTLNNLYGLAQEKSDETPEVVLKLSQLMSYILYEADVEKVALSKEAEQIENYISLEKVRYGERFTTSFNIEGDVLSTEIPPLLFIPFVENAFKHGVNRQSKGSWIKINLKVSSNQLQFTIENSINVQAPRAGNGGLGIVNARKRLALLFPDRHHLCIGQHQDSYKVTLKIDLMP